MAGSVMISLSFLQFLTRLTERFVLGVDMFVETLWKVWAELLDVLGLDGRCGGRSSEGTVSFWCLSNYGSGTHSGWHKRKLGGQ